LSSINCFHVGLAFFFQNRWNENWDRIVEPHFRLGKLQPLLPRGYQVPERLLPERSVLERLLPERSVTEMSVPERSVTERLVKVKRSVKRSVPERSFTESSVPERSVTESLVPVPQQLAQLQTQVQQLGTHITTLVTNVMTKLASIEASTTQTHDKSLTYAKISNKVTGFIDTLTQEQKSMQHK